MNKNSANILQSNKVQIITLITGSIQLAEGNLINYLILSIVQDIKKLVRVTKDDKIYISNNLN
jgi:hypothetical protein